MEISLQRLGVILLFIITFTVVGYAAPAIYATYADKSHYMEVHSLTAQNMTTGDSQHYACFDRTVKTSSVGDVYVEMYYVNNRGEFIELDSVEMERYFQKGRAAVKTPIPVRAKLEPGAYNYTLVVSMDFANGAVTRTFVYKSKEFHVKEDGNATGENFKCPPA